MVRENPILKQGFSDDDFYNLYMDDSNLPRTTTYLPWGWAGLVPIMELSGKWRYSNSKGGTFNGICPLLRLGTKRFAFTDVAWEAILPVLEELAANPVELRAEKNRVLCSLRAKRKRTGGPGQEPEEPEEPEEQEEQEEPEEPEEPEEQGRTKIQRAL